MSSPIGFRHPKHYHPYHSSSSNDMAYYSAAQDRAALGHTYQSEPQPRPRRVFGSKQSLPPQSRLSTVPPALPPPAPLHPPPYATILPPPAGIRNGDAGFEDEYDDASWDEEAVQMAVDTERVRDSRGATLEVVISRMKAKGDVRFVALSATVPNIDDVARWIGPTRPDLATGRGVYEGGGKDDTSAEPVAEPLSWKTMPKAKVFKFGEEFRPTKLKREICGYAEAGNDWAFANKLDKELFSILLRHSEGQASLVFCPTRKGMMVLIHVNADGQAAPRLRNAKPPSLSDPKLAELAQYGIAVHHAGLEFSDRKLIEEGFKDGNIELICCTSTLAVGVNLPAHTVVIKGTKAYTGFNFTEYSDIEIQQMTGRAGRPQYDTSGTVVVWDCLTLTESTLTTFPMKGDVRKRQGQEGKLEGTTSLIKQYRDMIYSETVLESCLHENLTELRSRMVAKVADADSFEAELTFTHSSFLFIRIQQNPRHYAFAAAMKPGDTPWADWLDIYVADALDKLHERELIEDVAPAHQSDLQATEFGKIMSRTNLSFGTMCQIMNIKEDEAGLRDLLEVFSSAVEFEDLRIRGGESKILNKLRASPEIKFPLNGPVKTTSDKIMVLVQVCLANISYEDCDISTENASPHQMLFAIFRHAGRIAKGSKSIKTMALNGIQGFGDLLNVDPSQLEGWLGRNSPFGNNILKEARSLPRYEVKIIEDYLTILPGEYPVAGLTIEFTALGTRTKSKARWGVREYIVDILFITNKGQVVFSGNGRAKDMQGGSNALSASVTFKSSDEVLIANIGVEDLAGCSTTVEYRPAISPSAFPILQPDEHADPSVTDATGPTRGGAQTYTEPKKISDPLFLPRSSSNMISSSPLAEWIDLTSRKGRQVPGKVRDTPPLKKVSARNPSIPNQSLSKKKDAGEVRRRAEENRPEVVPAPPLKRRKLQEADHGMDGIEEWSDEEDQRASVYACEEALIHPQSPSPSLSASDSDVPPGSNLPILVGDMMDNVDGRITPLCRYARTDDRSDESDDGYEQFQRWLDSAAEA
ncbi:hypothetical protein P7C73_g538, partial [Tremellales sp. Uapishka_1]